MLVKCKNERGRRRRKSEKIAKRTGKREKSEERSVRK